MEAINLSFPTTLDFEIAARRSIDWAALSVDKKKCFDLFAPRIICNLIIAMGGAREVATAYRNYYEKGIGPRTRLTIGRWTARQFHQWNSMIQGDVYVILGCNTLFSVLVARVNEVTPDVKVNSLFDDTLLRAPAGNINQLKIAWQESCRHTKLAGQVLNANKSKGIAANEHTQNKLKEFLPEGMSTGHNTKNLGIDLQMGRRVMYKTPRDRLLKSRDTVKNIARLPLPRDAKESLTACHSTKGYTWGAAYEDIPKHEANLLRSATVRTLWEKRRGAKRNMRSTEMLFTLIVRGHLVDPLQAFYYDGLCDLRRYLREYPNDREPFFNELQSQKGADFIGPPAPVLNFRKILRSLHWACDINGTIIDDEGNKFHLLTAPEGQFRHKIREGLRRYRWRTEAEKKPRMIKGVEQKVRQDLLGLDRVLPDYYEPRSW